MNLWSLSPIVHCTSNRQGQPWQVASRWDSPGLCVLLSKLTFVVSLCVRWQHVVAVFLLHAETSPGLDETTLSRLVLCSRPCTACRLPPVALVRCSTRTNREYVGGIVITLIHFRRLGLADLCNGYIMCSNTHWNYTLYDRCGVLTRMSTSHQSETKKRDRRATRAFCGVKEETMDGSHHFLIL